MNGHIDGTMLHTILENLSLKQNSFHFINIYFSHFGWNKIATSAQNFVKRNKSKKIDQCLSDYTDIKSF